MYCEDCYTTENVKEVACPFESDMNNKIVMVCLCPECQEKRAMET